MQLTGLCRALFLSRPVCPPQKNKDGVEMERGVISANKTELCVITFLSQIFENNWSEAERESLAPGT